MRPLAPLPLVVLGLAAGALGGCGGGEDEGAASRVAATDGAGIFQEAGCAGCHALEDARATGLQGPNLDRVDPSAAEVERQVREGGGGMPPYGERLSDEQVSAVARYVDELAGSPR